MKSYARPTTRCLTALIALVGLTAIPVLADSSDMLEQLQRFNRILTLVKHNYVDSVETEALIDGAIEGLLKDLDPHTNYLKPDANERMQELNSGEYSGIGISFDIIDDVLTVISPLEGSPSYELGIRPGDRIVEIEGESAIGITQTEVMEKLRGRSGTQVTIGIQRAGREELLHFTITRSKIAIKSVPYHFMLSEDIGFVRASRFSATTADELEEALADLESQGMEKLILDLRGNTGGYLNQAIEVTDKFIGGGKLVVYTKGRIRGSSEEYFSSEGATHDRFPLIVMIDRGSASASEIVSGAIQDWDRGLVVGTTSFGKGLVQRQFPLRGGGSLLLTVAKYYTPSGRLIQRPYDHRDRLQYLQEAGTDGHASDEEPEVVEAEEAEMGDEERPTFMTAAGRPVYGGGGITPDVFIKADYSITEEEEALLNADNRTFFNFAGEVLLEQGIRDQLGDFATFLATWHLDDAHFDRFKTYCAEREIPLTTEQLDAEREFIDHWVRVELAGHVWTPSERYRVIIGNDPAVQASMNHFPEAASLARGDIEEFLQLTSVPDAKRDEGTHREATEEATVR